MSKRLWIDLEIDSKIDSQLAGFQEMTKLLAKGTWKLMNQLCKKKVRPARVRIIVIQVACILRSTKHL